MKKFVKINENVFKLGEVDFQQPPVSVGDFDVDSPLPTVKSNQINRVKEQLNNFISVLDTKGEEGLQIIARDLVVLAKQIIKGSVDTY